MAELIPFALKDAPALIETVFPVQKVSWEAQKERKANLGQTLTGLGSYWKGRKPLIQVRAILLGCLLPDTGNAEEDLAMFEALMAFDLPSLARRAVIQNKVKPKDIVSAIDHNNPWSIFTHNRKSDEPRFHEIETLQCPFSTVDEGIIVRWRRDISDSQKAELLETVLSDIPDYAARANLCKRPEEIDQEWLYDPVWEKVNTYYAALGINANSHNELIDQFGVLRFGHRPKAGDAFCGGGSIPFEAARLGFDVFASDLNPIACMLTWGALNIVGASKNRRKKIEEKQRDAAAIVDEQITALGIEHDKDGNRAKSYLYCLETLCPETGWMIPLSPSWIISKSRNVLVELMPNYELKRFDLNVKSASTESEMLIAATGTIQDGSVVYDLDGITYRIPIKTLRGDYRDVDNVSQNKLRQWDISDFMPRVDDVFQERLYAIHWITRETLTQARQETFFTGVSEDDVERETQVNSVVATNLEAWQAEGLIPDMEIESGAKTDEPIRTRGWTHWHHLFNSRQLLLHALYAKQLYTPELFLVRAKALDWNSRLCHWITDWEKTAAVFYSQALNTFYNYGCRAYSADLNARIATGKESDELIGNHDVSCLQASQVKQKCDIWVTDPPYADAVHYHEITEFFIAWLRKNPPERFRSWTWDSKRALAIKGSGDEFRKSMILAYKAMANNMAENGVQCVMFTHQDAGVWSDMIGIFWASGLQVIAAWYIATETTSELKKGGYVQGTITLILRMRESGDKKGYRQQVLPAVQREVDKQIRDMMNLNDTVLDQHGESVFNDSDLQMAGYAAALKVLTRFTHIDGEDVTSFGLRPKKKGEVTVVDEIVQQAAEIANSLLVPEDLGESSWGKISGIQRFYLRMLDMEAAGISKLDNYQNFAKAFRVTDYQAVMKSVKANAAALKQPEQFKSRELTDSNEIGGTQLGHVFISLQQLANEVEADAVVRQLSADLPDFLDQRTTLIDLARFLQSKAKSEQTRQLSELLADRLQNLKALGQ